MFLSLKNNKCTLTETQLSAVDALIESISLVKEDKEEVTIEELFQLLKFQILFDRLL